MMGHLDRWLHGATATITPLSLAVTRILYASALLFALMPSFRWIESFPNVFYSPPVGPLVVFDGFPPGPFFTLAGPLFGILLALMLVGWRTQVVSYLLSIGLVICFGFSYSFGKINHTMLLVVVPALLGAAGWGSELSLDKRAGRPPTRRVWPMTVLMFVVGWMMFSAGILKLTGGWLALDTQATRGHHLAHLVTDGDDALLAELVAERANSFFYELLDWGTVMFEVGMLLSVISLKWFRRLLVCAVGFHLSVLVMLNIPYWGNFPAYAAFVPWASVASRPRWVPDLERIPIQAMVSGSIVAGAVLGLLTSVSQPILALLLEALGVDGSQALERMVIYVSVAVVARLAWTARRSRADQACLKGTPV